MTASLAHRGPDDEGYFFEGPVGLGFRRLSIIDLAGGHQPMGDAQGSVWVVFNGEIYNFQELRQVLEGFGHTFRTRADTEVIVHGYKQWGDGLLERLNGMFGLAIWDTRARRLIVARDAFGIKPVYYRVEAGTLSFGSEMRAVLAASRDASPDIDPIGLAGFLRYRFTPAPRTILSGIRKLAPGTMLVVERGQCEVHRWYRYEPTPFSPPKTDGEAIEALGDIYRRALKRHLISDVPVGLLLSGGVDSGLLLALMNLYGSSWPTFTVGYGSTYVDDELVEAAETASQLGSAHTEVRIDRSDFERALPRIVASLEEPVASSSVVPMYFVCERARQDVKVALSGQGPDELLGGYTRHLGVRYGRSWSALPTWARTSLGAALGALPRNEALKRGVFALDVPERMRRYQHVLSIRPGPQIASLFRPDLVDAAFDAVPEGWTDLEPLMGGTDELGGLQFLEMRSTIGDELLMYSDKMSMAHGLELRVPYLDRELVEYVERLSGRFKVRRGTRKWIHRQIGASVLPRTMLTRKKKGFGVNVVDQWFGSGGRGPLEDMLLDESSLMYRYLCPTQVRRLFDDHRRRRQDNHKILFSLTLLEQWLRQISRTPHPSVDGAVA